MKFITKTAIVALDANSIKIFISDDPAVVATDKNNPKPVTLYTPYIFKKDYLGEECWRVIEILEKFLDNEIINMNDVVCAMEDDLNHKFMVTDVYNHKNFKDLHIQEPKLQQIGIFIWSILESKTFDELYEIKTKLDHFND